MCRLQTQAIAAAAGIQHCTCGDGLHVLHALRYCMYCLFADLAVKYESAECLLVDPVQAA